MLSGGRKTALALVIAILAVELLASHQVQAGWKALWGPIVPLGKGQFAAATSGSGSNNNNQNNNGPTYIPGKWPGGAK